MKARYYTEGEICALIDRCHRNSADAIKRAAAIKEQYRAIQIWFAREKPNPDPVELEQHRQELIALKITWRRLEKYAANQIDKKAAKLRDKLGEFKTTFLHFNQRDSKLLRADDRSVEAI